MHRASADDRHISGPHLNVLQTLVLNQAFPESLLRVTGKSIARLLDTSAGLQPVFQACKFDADAVRQKLLAAGVDMSRPTITSRDQLCRALGLTRTLNLASATWPKLILDALDRSLAAEGPSRTLSTISSQVVDGRGLGDGTIVYIASLVLAQKVSVYFKPLYTLFVDTTLSSLFDSRTSPLNPPATVVDATETLARMIKQVLLLVSLLDPSSASALAKEIAAELGYHRSRPVAGATSAESGPKRKRIKRDEMSQESHAALEALTTALSNDEDLRNKWPEIRDLSGSPS